MRGPLRFREGYRSTAPSRRKGPRLPCGSLSARRVLALLAAFLALCAALPATAESRLLDRVVAVITPGGAERRGTVITLSELTNEARIALIRAGGVLAADAPIPEETLAATLQQLVAEHLLQAEAEDLAVAVVDPAEEGAALQAFRARFGSPEAYRRFLRGSELTEADVERVLHRGLAVERYLASRARLAVTVSEVELQRAWKERGGAPDGLAQARGELRRELERRRREELVAALVADLRSRARVRVVHDLGAAPALPPEEE